MNYFSQLLSLLVLFFVFSCAKNEASVEDIDHLEPAVVELLLNEEFSNGQLSWTNEYYPNDSHKRSVHYNELGETDYYYSFFYENDTIYRFYKDISSGDSTLLRKWYAVSDDVIREDIPGIGASLDQHKLYTISSQGCGPEMIQYFTDNVEFRIDSIEFTDINCSEVRRRYLYGVFNGNAIFIRDGGNIASKSKLNPLLNYQSIGNIVEVRNYDEDEYMFYGYNQTIIYNEDNYPTSVSFMDTDNFDITYDYTYY